MVFSPKNAKVLHFRELKEGLQCLLCPHGCILQDGEMGLCGIRYREGNSLWANNYREIMALALDPMEKKPLYHFYPGTYILSAGARGCNFHCPFCQNYSLARGQRPGQGQRLNIDELMGLARDQGSVGMAFTYAEPLMWYETLFEILPLIKDRGLKTVLITNGYINPGPLQDLLPYIDAVNLDLKTFSEETYERVCGGSLEVVKESAGLIQSQSHLEITTLIVPHVSHSPEEIQSLCRWVKRELGPHIPLHLSRYFPAHEYRAPATSLALMKELYTLSSDILYHVYLGNVRDSAYQKTLCPHCKALLIGRDGRVVVTMQEGNNCPNCGQTIYCMNNT